MIEKRIELSQAIFLLWAQKDLRVHIFDQGTGIFCLGIPGKILTWRKINYKVGIRIVIFRAEKRDEFKKNIAF